MSLKSELVSLKCCVCEEKIGQAAGKCPNCAAVYCSCVIVDLKNCKKCGVPIIFNQLKQFFVLQSLKKYPCSMCGNKIMNRGRKCPYCPGIYCDCEDARSVKNCVVCSKQVTFGLFITFECCICGSSIDQEGRKCPRCPAVYCECVEDVEISKCALCHRSVVIAPLKEIEGGGKPVVLSSLAASKTFVWRDTNITNQENAALWEDLKQRYGTRVNMFGVDNDESAYELLAGVVDKKTLFVASNRSKGGMAFLQKCREKGATNPAVMYCSNVENLVRPEWLTVGVELKTLNKFMEETVLGGK